MQKKLVALAVAGLVSGAAFAQSNVTVSGTVDMAFTNGSDSVTNNVGSRAGLDDGGWDSSRIRFEGKEDLGNGMAVSFRQEFGTNLDNGVGGVRIRKSWLALEGKNWGVIKAGHFGNVHDDINGYSEVGGMSYGNSVLEMLSADTTYNALQYVSPNFSGLQFKLGLSTHDFNATEPGDNDANARAYSAQVSYENGPLKAGLSYDRKKVTDNNSKATEWLASVGYDFGVVKVGAGYDRVRNTENLYGVANGIAGAFWDKKVAYRLNIGAPIGATNDIAFSYSHVKYDWVGTGSEAAKGYGISFVHKMSKRTNLYAAYGTVSQDEDVPVGVNDYQDMFKVGIRHEF